MRYHSLRVEIFAVIYEISPTRLGVVASKTYLLQLHGQTISLSLSSALTEKGKHLIKWFSTNRITATSNKLHV